MTYNWGKSGVDVEQSPWKPGQLHPRGCKSQNGATCLANQGWGYKDILHFYYGADVLISESTDPVSKHDMSSLRAESVLGPGPKLRVRWGQPHVQGDLCSLVRRGAAHR